MIIFLKSHNRRCIYAIKYLLVKRLWIFNSSIGVLKKNALSQNILEDVLSPFDYEYYFQIRKAWQGELHEKSVE